MTTPNRQAANIFLNVLKLQDAGFFCTFTYHTEVSTDDGAKPSMACLAIYKSHSDFMASNTDPLKVVVALPDQFEKLCDDLEDFLNANNKPN